MTNNADSSSFPSLASASPGDCLSFERILFDYVRVLCSMYDIAEGDVVTCHAIEGAEMVVSGRAGRSMRLDRDWTRFILTRGCPDGDSAAHFANTFTPTSKSTTTTCISA
jgi:hypothetical protein